MGFVGDLVGDVLDPITGRSAAEEASEEAIASQERMADESAQVMREMYQQTREDFQPFLRFGKRALPQINRLSRDFRGFEEGFDPTESPVYQAQKNEMLRTLGGEFAAGGLKKSSAFENALIRNQAPLIMGEYNRQYGMLGDEYNRLLNRVKIGQGAAGSTSSASLSTGRGLANIYGNLGQSQAAGQYQLGNIATTYSPFNVLAAGAGTVSRFL